MISIPYFKVTASNKFLIWRFLICEKYFVIDTFLERCKPRVDRLCTSMLKESRYNNCGLNISSKFTLLNWNIGWVVMKKCQKNEIYLKVNIHCWQATI
jgi:hypothetical protein